MNANDFLKSGEFLRKEDLEKVGERSFHIDNVDVAEFGETKTGTTERKLQLVLDDGVRFTLNATNTRILMKHYSNDTARWAGKPVTLVFDESVQYAGRMVGGIRVRVPKVSEAPGVGARGLTDEEIPF